MVLLLSEDHHRHLRDCGGSSIPPTSQGNITDPEMRTFLNPDKRSGTSDTASPSQKAGSSQCPSRVVPCGSLVPVECFKVSLGKTDAFICKYKKAPASGPPPAGCHEPGAPPEMASLPESPRLQDSLQPQSAKCQASADGCGQGTHWLNKASCSPVLSVLDKTSY